MVRPHIALIGALAAGTGCGVGELGELTDDATAVPVEESLPLIAARIGDWCGPVSHRSTWLVVDEVVEDETCQEVASRVYGDADRAGRILIQLPEGSADSDRAGPQAFTTEARVCVDAACETRAAELVLDASTETGTVTGSWTIGGLEAGAERGRFRASLCDWDTWLPASPENTALAAGTRVRDVELYQAVQIPLVRNGQEVTERNADVVQNRPGQLRLLVDTDDDFEAREVTARVTFSSVGETHLHEIPTRLTAGGATIVDIPFDAEDIRHDTTWSVELIDAAPCVERSGDATGARWPEAGRAPLTARRVGIVKVVVVPVRYKWDGDRLPDTSDDVLEDMRQGMLAYYPVEDVQISVREPLEWDDPVGAWDGGSWSWLLNGILWLRDQDEPTDDTFYFGLVNPETTWNEYCARGCIGGIAPQAYRSAISQRAGLGVGYPVSFTTTTFIHELGHAHGRGHAPCGGPDGVDGSFPYPGGRIGVPGFNLSTGEYIDEDATDIMGYCDDIWISDYTYQGLADRISYIHQQPFAPSTAPQFEARPLLVDEAGAVRWGEPRRVSATEGEMVTATAVDPEGHALHAIDIQRVTLGCTESSMYLVPTDQPQWHAIDIPTVGRVSVFAL